MATTITPAHSSFFFSIAFFTFLLHAQEASSQLVTKPIKSFSSGTNFACAAFEDKRIKCWGDISAWGESRDPYDPNYPVGDDILYIDVGTSIGVEKLSSGGRHVCMKTDTNQLKCLGFNNHGQIGIGTYINFVGRDTGYIGDSLPFINVGSGLEVLDVVVGYLHSCIFLTGNKVKCFGQNFFGQLGIGDTIDRGTNLEHMGDNLPFIDFGTGVEVASIHSGPLSSHNCVIFSSPAQDAGRFKCWGYGYSYNLGYGNRDNYGSFPSEMGDNLPLVDLGTESRVKQITTGGQHTCALLVDNQLKCMGYERFGQLGSGTGLEYIGTTGNSLPTVLIDSEKSIKLMTTGHFHNCILYDDMVSIKCFGNNPFGQLGQGDIFDRGNTLQTMIPFIPNVDLGTGLLKIKLLSAGGYFNCVVFEDNNVKCFGANDQGQLVVGTNINVGDKPGDMGFNLKYSILFSPTKSPTSSPTLPTSSPTRRPTISPTSSPTFSPTSSPSASPTKKPTKSPTSRPTKSPTSPTKNPTSPTKNPTSPTKTPTRNPTTSKPTTKSPTNAQVCAKIWDQCAGLNFNGGVAKCCESGTTCSYQNDWYSQCLPNGATPTTRSPTVPPPTLPPGCRKVWEQCAGRDFNGGVPRCCEPGSTCKYQNDWYSQCLP